MKKAFRRLVFLLSGLVALPALASPPVTFEQATRDYADGRYAQALSEFEFFRARYPNNVQIHYYEALCYQSLNRLDKAKVEYEFVANGDNGRLKALAQGALQTLSHARTNGTVAASQSPVATGKTGSAADDQPLVSANGKPIQVANSTAPSTNSGDFKVRKVIEFYADW